MVALKALFKLPPSIAIKYFRNKKNTNTWDWYELWQKSHRKSFTVAKVVNDKVLTDIRSALDDALENGKTFHEFQKELKPLLQKRGWWGMREPCVESDTALRRQRRKRTKPIDGDVGTQAKPSTTGADLIVVDSQGNAEKVQLGSMYRLKTIYAVNLQTAYQTGRYQTQIENKEERPYWQYVAVLDSNTRPEHAQLHDLIFPCDDPFWGAFYPPNGWRCRCRVRALSEDYLKRKGLSVEQSMGKLSEELQLVSKKSGEYKPVTVYTDPLTGKKLAPDVGWSYNPASDF